MKEVFYLCNNEKGFGLVFPKELPKDYYTIGCHCICLNPNETLPEKITCQVLNQGNLESLELQKNNDNYQVIIGEVTLEFKTKISKDKYVGNSSLLNTSQTIYQLVPTDIRVLDQLFLKKRIVLVGKSE